MRAPSVPEFTRAFGIPSHSLQIVLDALQHGGLLMQTDDEPAVLPAGRDPALIGLDTVLETVRAAGEDLYLTPAHLPAPARSKQVLDRLRNAVAQRTRRHEPARPGRAS